MASASGPGSVATAVAPNREPIVLPVHGGQDGHPVRFDASLGPDLARLTGERGARALLQRHPAHRIPVTDVGVVRDLDTPADLAPSPLGMA